MKTTEKVDAIVRGAIAEMGYELDEVEYIKEHGNMVLTLYIDAPAGISLEDCERVSRAVDPMLDEADPIAEPYYLSVSSIGIDRPLKKDRDYERNLGKRVDVKLYAPVNKKKEFTGALLAFDEEAFTIAPEGKGGAVGAEMRIARKDAALVRPHIDFE